MALDKLKEEALLEWVNSMKLDLPVFRIIDLQDGLLLMRIVHKLKQEEPSETVRELPSENRFQLIADFLQRECRYLAGQGTMVNWDNLVHGKNPEVELSKVVLLLLFQASIKGSQSLNVLEYRIELELASMLRFVMESESEISISNCLEKYLKKESVVPKLVRSDCSSASFTDDESPIFQRSQRVQFLELNTVATSSVSSPLQDIMKTPQFQRRMHLKELAQEREMRDELERELANSKTTIQQRETQIHQLQHRLERLQREQAELEEGPKAELEELHTKNQRLQSRLHEVLKQHQDLKTTSAHMERKVDELTEENGTLSVQVGEVCSRLVSAEAEVGRLTETQTSAQEKWKNRNGQLTGELRHATAEKECLNEKILILQSKIQSLEDELSRALAQEKGESMGPIMEWEQLRQELAVATHRHTELEITISRLEGEILQTKAQHAEEKAKLQSESQHLQNLVSDLQGTLSSLKAEKEALQLALKEQSDSLNAQHQSLSQELDRLTAAIQQKEKEVQALREELLEERRKGGELSLALEKQEREAREEIQDLKVQMETIETSLKGAEVEIQAREGQLVSFQNESSAQKEELREEIQSLRLHVGCMEESLRKAEQDVRAKEELLATNQQENTKQTDMLQECVAATKEEVERLKEAQSEKEVLLLQATEKMEALQAEISTVSSLSADKDLQLSSLREEVANQSNSLRSTEQEVQAKEELLARLQEENVQQKELLQQEIQSLKAQMENMADSLRRSEEELHAKEAQLARTQEELVQQKDELQEQVASNEKEVRSTREEVQAKEEQLEALKTEISSQKGMLQEEIRSLEVQMENMVKSLSKAEEEIQAKQELLAKKEQEHHQQQEVLQSHVASTEEEVRELKLAQSEKEVLLLQATEKMEALQAEISTVSSLSADKDLQLSNLREEMANQSNSLRSVEQEVQTKEELLARLQEENVQQKELLQQEIQNLKAQMENMADSLKRSEEEIHAKEAQLTRTQEESAHQADALQGVIQGLKCQVDSVEASLKKADAELQQREELLARLQTDRAQQEDLLQAEIKNLTAQVDTMTASLQKALEDTKAKEEQLATQQQESVQLKEALQEKLSTSEEEVHRLKQEVQTKEELLEILRKDNTAQGVLQEEILSVREQIGNLNATLRKAEVEISTKKEQLAKNKQESAQQLEILQNLLSSTEGEVRELKLAQSEKEVLLLQATEKMEALQAEISTVSSLSVDKDLQLNSLREEMANQSNSLRSAEQEVQTKEELLARLQEENVQQKELLQQEIQGLKAQMENMADSLRRAKEDIQAKEEQLTRSQEEFAQQKEELQDQVASNEKEVQSTREEVQSTRKEVQAKEEQLEALKTEISSQKGMLQEEIHSLKAQMENMADSLRSSEEEIQAKQEELSKQKQYDTQQREILQEQLSVSEEEVKKLKEDIQTKEEILAKQEQDMTQYQEVLAKKEQDMTQHQEVLARKEQEMTQYQEVLAKKEQDMTQYQEVLARKEQETTQYQEVLQQLAANEANLNQFRVEHAALKEELALKAEALQEAEAAWYKEKDSFLHERETLETRVLQAEGVQKEQERQLEALCLERDSLAAAKQAMQLEGRASHTLEEALQREVASLRSERNRLLEMQMQSEQKEKQTKDMQEQLSAKTEAVEHYKAQVEKAKAHYSGKKAQLQESQEQVQELQRLLEVKEHEFNAVSKEMVLLNMDLDKIRSNEKLLSSQVASLEAQLAFADRNLREQGRYRGGLESKEAEPQKIQACTQPDKSNDSLDYSLDDSLNTTRKPSVPEESSTPMVRSSERLASKRKALGGESLETLYFTPMNSRQQNRTSTERRLEGSITSLAELALDSARKPPTSSARRRRTTQVINITMSKKTPGRDEDASDDHNGMFFTLPAARSHPNLTHSQASRPVSMEIFSTPGEAGFGSSDQLLSLPGYRRSTAHSIAPPRSTSTFCVGAENEPEHAGEDWMRIAELQARNKACLPHLKSSYPLEIKPIATPAFTFTDDDLRMGDPTETIRRASMMPGQILDSLSSNRLSMMPGQILDSLSSHRLSMMPGQIAAGVSSHRLSLAPKASESQVNQTHVRANGKRAAADQLQNISPQSKRQASCFPRPLTPKDKNRLVSSSTLKHQPLSPADRRQSMMFTIDNTPQKASKNILQRGMNKLRSSTRKSPGNSTRKSPGNSSRKSPAQVARRSPKKQVGAPRAGTTRAVVKSPQVGAGVKRRSPRTSSNATPSLTSSARKDLADCGASGP